MAASPSLDRDDTVGVITQCTAYKIGVYTSTKLESRILTKREQ